MSRASLRRLFKERPPASIVVIRTDRVGDLILSTPFLQALRRHFDQARICLWVDTYCGQVLSEASFVDRVVTSQPSEAFDLAIALAPRTECLKKAKLTKAPVRAGYVYEGRPLVRLLAHRYLTHHEVIPVKPPHHLAHEVEHLDRLARALGMPSTQDYPLDIGYRFESQDWLVLHLGDRWFTRGWGVDDIVRLCYGLERFGRLVITAGPREAEILRSGGFQDFDLRTGLRFSEWCQLIGEARMLVSPDTGAVHVAAALNTPVVVAYESDTFEHCSAQWRPWKVSHRAVVKGHPEATVQRILQAVTELAHSPT